MEVLLEAQHAWVEVVTGVDEVAFAAVEGGKGGGGPLHAVEFPVRAANYVVVAVSPGGRHGGLHGLHQAAGLQHPAGRKHLWKPEVRVVGAEAVAREADALVVEAHGGKRPL